MDQLFSVENQNQVFFRCVEDCFEPIMITDRRGRLRYVNPAWVLVYGYSKEEAFGHTPRLLRSEFQTDDFYKTMWETILDPKIGFWRGEVINCAKDGHLVPVLLTITPYRDSMGEILGYMGIAVDLSEHKKMETQILRQDRLASIGLLAGGLAHEIGNPLGTIQGRAELLMSAVKGNEAAEKSLEIIISQIDRIAKLLRSLLRVSRVPEKILLRPVNLLESVNDVVQLMVDPLRKNRIELKLENLNIDVLAEPNHLQQLFLNLIINAMHAIEEKGGERNEISISALSEGDHCVIKVKDTGTGIPKERLDKIFQPFFTTKAAGKGTGMGLAIVTKLVDEMQGTIAAESEGPGHGAVFVVRLKRGEQKN
jgi:PAS domain S-box-containing protein